MASLVESQHVSIAGASIAYRQVGKSLKSDTPPLVLLQHFRGTMNHWDFQYIDALAATRLVILVDYVGVGESSGSVRDTCLSSAQDIIAFAEALGLKSIDLLGFSIGGFVAQLVAIEAPTLVRRLILVGTGPSAGDGLESGPQELFLDFVNAATLNENRSIYIKAFFSPLGEKQGKAGQWWARIHPSEPDFVSTGSDAYLDQEGTKAQVEAIVKWVSGASTSGVSVEEAEKSYERLDYI